MTPQQSKELEALAAKPDAEIDLSDIPEITDWRGAVRGKFSKPATSLLRGVPDRKMSGRA